MLDIAPPSGASIGEKLGAMRQLAPLANAIPKTVRKGSCQDVVIRSPTCASFRPATWRSTAARSSRFRSSSPKIANRAAQRRMYRMQVYGPTETGMHWQRHKQGRAHADAWGDRVPVAVAIGSDPVLTYALRRRCRRRGRVCVRRLLRGKPVELVAAKTVDLKVSADANSCSKATWTTDVRMEGPFGDHTGVYSLAIAIRRSTSPITHRRDPSTRRRWSGNRDEDAWIGKATERIFLPLLQMVLPKSWT